DVRRVAPAALVLRSVHDAAELGRAAGEAADALIVSRGCALSARIPSIVIGAMTPARAPEALAAGAFGVAAIRALRDAPDPGVAAQAFLAVLPRTETVAVLINGTARRARQGLSLAG